MRLGSLIFLHPPLEVRPGLGVTQQSTAVDAVKAGNDVILWPTDLDGAFHGIVDAVKRREIPMATIDRSVLKILEMKASVGLNESRLVNISKVSALTGRPEDMDFAQHVADQAVTLVRYNRRMLPLQKSPWAGGSASHEIAPPLVAIIVGDSLEATNGRKFEEALKARRTDVQIFHLDNRGADRAPSDILDAVKNAGSVVVAAYVTHRETRQVRENGMVISVYGLVGPSGRFLRNILAIAPTKTAVVVFGSPYLIESFPEIANYICTYAMASTSEISAVKALFGEIQNHAKLPVTLPGVAPRGYSLPWPTNSSSTSLGSSGEQTAHP